MTNYDINEAFVGGWLSVYPGMNWPTTIPTAGSYHVDASGLWADWISIFNYGTVIPYPPADCSGVPCQPLWTNPGQGPRTLVQEIGQSWFVGSSQSGQGARVQTNLLQRYTDTGMHANIVTPNP